jgi:hypothetical protein
MVKRARRAEARRERGEIRLTPRDIEILEAIGRMRYVTTAQLARLSFAGSQWAARKRLRRLLDAGCLRCWVPRLDAPNIYALTRRGARILGEPGPEGEPWPAPRALDGRLEHLLAINSLRVALAVTLEAEDAVIHWWRSDAELARRSSQVVVPDALFRVAWPDAAHIFALEVDRTPPAPQMFIRRLLRYQGFGTQVLGVEAFTLLVVGSKALWVERAQQRAGSLGLGLPVSFGMFDAVQADGARAEWRSSRGDVHPSLRAVASAAKGGAFEERRNVEQGLGAQAREPLCLTDAHRTGALFTLRQGIGC